MPQRHSVARIIQHHHHSSSSSSSSSSPSSQPRLIIQAVAVGARSRVRLLGGGWLAAGRSVVAWVAWWRGGWLLAGAKLALLNLQFKSARTSPPPVPRRPPPPSSPRRPLPRKTPHRQRSNDPTIQCIVGSRVEGHVLWAAVCCSVCHERENAHE